MKLQRDKIIGQRFERAFQVEREAIDREERTAWLSIASSQPYERYFGVEVLDMHPECIRQDRLKSGAPLLVGHDTCDQVGVIERYSIGSEKLRVLARFGRSARAEEIFQDVCDGIRRNASVGYIVHDLVLESQEGDQCTYRVTDWEPLEGSLVPVPADPTVGVGRELAARNTKGKRKAMKEETDAGAMAGADVSTTGSYASRVGQTPKEDLAEALRVKALYEAGRSFRAEDLARELIDRPGATVDTFKTMLLERQRGAQRPMNTTQGGFGTSYGGEPVAWGSGARTGFTYGKLKAFEREEDAYRSGMWLRATLFNDRNAAAYCAQHGVRAMGEDQLSTGGATVPIELAQAYIRLVEQYGVFRQNARIWPMQSDQLKIARRDSGLSVFLVGENEAASEAAQGWGDITLSAKKWATLVRVSNELIEDTAIALADALTQDIALAFATKEDQCGFNGDATSTYGGMRGLTQILIDGSHNAGKVAATTGHNTLPEIDNTDLTMMMGKLPWYARKNAKFYCSSVAWDSVFSRLMAIAGGNRVGTLSDKPQQQYLGYPVVVSQTLPTSTTADYTNLIMILFGDLNLASAMGVRRELQVRADPSRYLEYDQMAFMCTERYDIVNHDCGDNTTAGPIVGLIGA